MHMIVCKKVCTHLYNSVTSCTFQFVSSNFFKLHTTLKSLFILTKHSTLSFYRS